MFFTLFLFKHLKNHPQPWKLNHSSQIVITWKKCASQERHILYSFVNLSFIFLQVCQPGKEGQRNHIFADKQGWQSGGNRWENWVLNFLPQSSLVTSLPLSLKKTDCKTWTGGPSHKGEIEIPDHVRNRMSCP